MLASSLMPVEKLVGREYYQTCKFAMKALLQLDNLWDIVKGEVGLNDKQKNEKALSKITLCIDPTNFSHLKKDFEDLVLTRRVGLLRTLVTTRLENCKSVDEYIDKIISTTHKLNEIEFDVKNGWIATLLLAGLPN
ncbi:hypothetical protein PR048_021666 [Dryococelus australis]|uniref:Uncharacterized protein n=1 Tax=Dryococelus australis TaxID=614101 RepID=A0ABQ9GYY2_9NEOP|nr:hypothetical protein PR048_021666 [Dryococelus australis]